MFEARLSASLTMAVAFAFACIAGGLAFSQAADRSTSKGAAAAEDLASVNLAFPGEPAKPVLRYVVFPAPPFMIGASGENGELSGIDVDIVGEIAARLGLEPRFIKATWARALELMRQGGADMLSSAFKTPEREAFMSYFSEPYLGSLPVGFYTWSGSAIDVQRYEDLSRAASIGVLNGASYFDRFDGDGSLPKVKVASQDQLFPMLANRRIDLIAGYVDTENYRLAVEGYRGQVTRMAYTVDNPVEVYTVLSKASPLASRLSEFDAANEGLLREGLIQKTIESYKRRYK